MATKKLTLAQRAKKDPKLRKRALADPGLRSKLPSSMLNPEQRQTRELNVRLKQPITPGSSITERDLAREAGSAMDVKYGPLQQQQQTALGQEQARGRDLGGWYDQYLRAVAQHSQNVQGIGAQAGQIGLGLQQGVTGLGQAGLAMVQNPANADAAARGATAGNLAPMENQALAVRQALTGSFVAQQTAQNAAQQSYADTMANVVAPGEKLGAMAQQAGKAKLAQDDITQTTRQRGADETVYRAGRKSDEAKQILAQQTLTGGLTDKKTQTDLEQQRINETTRANRADESEAGKKRRADQRKADRDAAAKGREPNQYGVPADQWAKWSSSHRQRVIDASKASSAKPKTLTPQAKYEQDFFKKYHVRPQSTAEVAKTREQRFPAITKALSDLQRANKRGKKLTLDEAGRLLSVGQPAGEIVITNKNKDLYPGEKVGSKHKTRKIDAYPAVLIRVIMDRQRMNGYISATTANRLHRSGYSVEQLGLKTQGKTPISTGTGNPASSTGTGLG
jgi:lipoprotein-anchoring transpeptidase ErfK/SrfK